MKDAFLKSIPIMCSYLFVSMAYGMMMENAGYHWYYSLLASRPIYIFWYMTEFMIAAVP